jgi:hypothetical protein
MEKKFLLVVLLAVAFLQGCGAHMHNPSESNASLVYGFIDMDEAPSRLDYASLRQYKPKPADDKAYWNTAGVDGVFWFDQLAPGSYQLVSFGGGKWWKNTNYTYNMPNFEKNSTALVITKPSLYFLGSYKYRDTGSFFNPAFDIDKVNSPTEKELLVKLLPLSTGTQWEALIQKRIRELK